jgi:hypothetical protein
MALLEAFRAQVDAHARFFDHLVELVPARHYVDREEAPANLKYMKKVARAGTPAQAAQHGRRPGAAQARGLPLRPQGARALEKERLREVGKQRKRARLDPDAAQPTALDLQREQAAAAPAAPKLLLRAGAARSRAPAIGAFLWHSSRMSGPAVRRRAAPRGRVAAAPAQAAGGARPACLARPARRRRAVPDVVARAAGAAARAAR